MKIAFRADASLQIGTGHVMRCLTLARGLRAAGAECHFILRTLPGHLGDKVSGEGFSCTLLSEPTGPAPQPPPDHAAWAGVDWAVDADDTRAVLDVLRPDWLVMDHYAFDARWQRRARPDGTKLLVIDDLADRPHECDLLLDQNLGRNASAYDGLVPDHCTRLIGPHYALLRPEFAALRAASLAGRAGRGLRRLMISMGGVDADDVTSSILQALAKADLPEQLEITVVMGGKAPALDHVRKIAATMPRPTDVVVDVPDMAARMAAADLAIGAAGSTSWERCAVGLPTIVLQIAANQAAVTKALVASGAATEFSRFDKGVARFSDVFAQTLTQLSKLSASAAELCDGDGLWRVMAALVPAFPGFRTATPEDSRRVYDWRAASGLERFSQSGDSPSFEQHHAWFLAALVDPARVFLIVLTGHLPCGYLRLDMLAGFAARVSLCLAPEARGKGLAVALLAEAERIGAAHGMTRLQAEIHPDNAPSVASFRRAAYSRGPDSGEFQTYYKPI